MTREAYILQATVPEEPSSEAYPGERPWDRALAVGELLDRHRGAVFLFPSPRARLGLARMGLDWTKGSRPP